MAFTAARRCLFLVSAAVVVGWAATPSHAASGDPFAYTMAITPEEGPTDPAIQRRYTAKFDACQKRARTTPENATCFEAEFPRQDAVLNRTWTATLARLPGAQHKRLVEAQREWIAARDPFCKRQSDDFSGGTIAPIVYVDCRVELTIRRSIWLERLR